MKPDPHRHNAAHLEVELKLELTSALDHATLAAALSALAGAPQRLAQVNLYFDTAGLHLRAARAMLRLRLETGGAQLTLKRRPQLRDGLMQVDELELEVPTSLAEDWQRRTPSSLCPAEWPDALRPITLALDGMLSPPTRLHALGAMTNERLRFDMRRDLLAVAAPPGANLCVELDHSLGPGGEERFELELEDRDAALLRPAIEAWLEAQGVEFAPSAESKYAWFLRGLGREVLLEREDSRSDP